MVQYLPDFKRLSLQIPAQLSIHLQKSIKRFILWINVRHYFAFWLWFRDFWMTFFVTDKCVSQTILTVWYQTKEIKHVKLVVNFRHSTDASLLGKIFIQWSSFTSCESNEKGSWDEKWWWWASLKVMTSSKKRSSMFSLLFLNWVLSSK